MKCESCESENLYTFDDGVSYACMDCGATVYAKPDVDMTEEE